MTDPNAPYTVTGFKGGYLTWNGAVKAAKLRGTTVTDKDGKQIYPPQPSPYQLEARAALRDNCCPKCRRPVRTNNTIRGWVQCSQFGNPELRKVPRDPSCNWQGFTV